MRYADPEAQAEIDRLRKQLRLAEQDEAEMARRLVSCRKAGDEMIGEIEKLEAELDRLREVLLAEWEKDRKTYAAAVGLRCEVDDLKKLVHGLELQLENYSQDVNNAYRAGVKAGRGDQ